MLKKKPGTTALVVTALGLGLAINTTMFTVVNSLLLQPLPYARPGELVELSQVPGNIPLTELTHARSLSGVASFTTENHPVGPMGEVRPVLGGRCSANLFRVLGVEALIGRVFSPEEDRGDTPQVVVLSYDYWRQISGDPKIIGQKLTIASQPYSIIGVLPPEFALGNRNINIWIAAGGTQSRIVARLAPGIAASQAEAELRAIAQASTATAIRRDRQVQLRPASQSLRAGSRDAQTVLLLQAAAIFILIITGANVGSLLLIQSSSRLREFAIRAAVGASRVQILRQLLTESAILTAMGTAVGLLLSEASLDFVASRLPGGLSSRLLARGGLTIDYRVLAFAALSALVLVVLCTAAASAGSWRLNLSSALKTAAPSSSPRRQVLGQALVSGEMALAIMLLIGAGLIFKGLWGLETASLGFDAKNVIRARFEPLASRYPRPDQRADVFAQLVQSIEAIPGVEAAGAISPQVFPFSGAVTPTSRFVVQEGAPGESQEEVRADVFAVNAHYFPSVRVPLLAGRLLSDADSADAPPVAVISQAFAKRYWGRENPVGRQIRLDRAGSAWISIAGVVGDVRNASGMEQQRIVYRPLAQAPPAGVALMIRTSVRDPLNLAGAIRSRLTAVDQTVPQYAIVDLQSAVLAYRDPQVFTASLWGLFAGVGLLLAALGVHGVMRSWVGAHVAEIGIRLAIGAQRRDVIVLVLRRAATACLAGLVVGVGGALALRKIIASELYGTSPADPAVFIGVAALIILTGLLAAFLPARSAARIDPLIALKQD